MPPALGAWVFFSSALASGWFGWRASALFRPRAGFVRFAALDESVGCRRRLLVMTPTLERDGPSSLGEVVAVNAPVIAPKPRAATLSGADNVAPIDGWDIFERGRYRWKGIALNQQELGAHAPQHCGRLANILERYSNGWFIRLARIQDFWMETHLVCAGDQEWRNAAHRHFGLPSSCARRSLRDHERPFSVLALFLSEGLQSCGCPPKRASKESDRQSRESHDHLVVSLNKVQEPESQRLQDDDDRAVEVILLLGAFGGALYCHPR